MGSLREVYEDLKHINKLEEVAEFIKWERERINAINVAANQVESKNNKVKEYDKHYQTLLFLIDEVKSF